MDISKLSSQLVKEAEKNPVKAGALGLLTLVALWFWAPLVWGWIRPADSAATETPTEATPTTTAAADPASQAPAAPAAVQFDWQGLVRARLTDPKLAVARWDSGLRDPFCEVKPPKPPQKKPTEAIVSTPPTTPSKSLRDLNLVLQGVMLGTKTKSATINGITLTEGAKFGIDAQGKISKKTESTTGDSLTIVEVREIRATEVLLVSEGKEVPLPLKKRDASSGTIEITRAP